VIGGRTKALLFVASLPLLICIGVVVWIGFAPYYARFTGKRFEFITFSFHFTLWLWIWTVTLLAGLISFLYDRRATRKP
jgi:hypothetical protein